ncbi:MAG: Lrp/AsnC family transcriptional regulator [Deltaproteobacteria bacterium]|nr:Lrp/AsnC family transcriptional regulator [Deltaproteobacteria bacterium]
MVECLNKTDHAIIRLLGHNARMTNTEIAERVGISESTVRNRIKKLVDNRVIQNIAVINPEILGYQLHSHIGIQVDYQKLRDVTEALKDLEAVHFLGSATGRYDLIIFCFFRTVDEQRHFLLEELAPIAGIVRTETLNIIKMYKTKYLWGVSILGSHAS